MPAYVPFHRACVTTVLLTPTGKPSGLVRGFAGWMVRPYRSLLAFEAKRSWLSATSSFRKMSYDNAVEPCEVW